MTPATVYEAIELLESYHDKRRANYVRLAGEGGDPRTDLLLQHLVKLEDDALTILAAERERLDPAHSTRLPTGTDLTIEPAHAVNCRCDEEPSFDEALSCALASDAALDEVIDKIAGSSAARSIQDLAARLRELERTKQREIDNFTRAY